MKRLFVLPALLALIMITGCNMSATRSPEPDGFQYYTAKNGVGTYLVPTGWHVREETQSGTNALFITRENIETQGQFQVGFTVNRVPNFSQQASVAPPLYARNFAEQLVVEHNTLISETLPYQDETLNVVRVRLSEDPPTIVHYLTLGREARDEFFLIFFEAPEDEWAQAFETGKIMLEGFSLPP